MIVLDTNVLSEPLRARPDARVMAWLGEHPEATMTAVSVGELLSGVKNIPIGKRRDALTAGILDVIDQLETVLPYDESAAHVFADLQDARRRLGRPLSTGDGMIAAICIARDLPLATRNVADFDGLGLGLVNPWDH